MTRASQKFCFKVILNFSKFALISFGLWALGASACFLIWASDSFKQSAVQIALAFVVFLTLGAFRLNVTALRASNAVFFQRLMGTLMGKLFLSIGFVLTAVYLKKVDIQSFLAVYFIAYFLFTFFEIYALLNNLHAGKEQT